MRRLAVLVEGRIKIVARRLEPLPVFAQHVGEMQLLMAPHCRNCSCWADVLAIALSAIIVGLMPTRLGIIASMPTGPRGTPAGAPQFSLAGKRVLVTGGAGFLGAPVCRLLSERGAREVVVPRRVEHDLTDARAVATLFERSPPDVVLHLAAEVGGIGANRDNPGRFFYANMAMGLNLVEQARRSGVQKFVQVGTVCSYPKFTPVPFSEASLWDGYPEETNAPYGIAKKALLVMLGAYREQYDFPGIFLMPTNLYGPRDNFDPRSSHVIPALIRKCEEARLLGEQSISCWGTGSASREFLYVDDCAEAIVAATERYDSPEPVNIGVGKEITIRDLVELIAQATDFNGEIRWDTSKPDGQPRRVLDTTRAREEIGFQALTSFADGMRATVEWFREHAPRGDTVASA
jgi:GDP-L-fucose synthase